MKLTPEERTNKAMEILSKLIEESSVPDASSIIAIMHMITIAIPCVAIGLSVEDTLKFFDSSHEALRKDFIPNYRSFAESLQILLRKRHSHAN